MGKRNRRPLSVTWTAYGVFLIGAGYCLQAGQAIFLYSHLEPLPFSVPPWYFIINGILWGIFWLIMGVGLWLGKEWARRITLIGIPVQLAAWLADWRLFSRSHLAVESFGFDFLLRLAAAAAGETVLLLAGRRRKVESEES
jgi:hypothetical protein